MKLSIAIEKHLSLLLQLADLVINVMVHAAVRCVTLCVRV